VQPVPEQRSTRYSATPVSSVDASQVRSTPSIPSAVAVRALGAEGAVVSGGAGVVAVTTFE
jgi:hypothetical protein